ncbi:vacuolar protein sorting-associated protein 54-like [Coccinella septempunctata]|uniref:vacuolar protein sorting-associated protein 54-like n=1 Tax=Coccinella septempunctata TaxID=41139 RepID=UPI001D0752E8|nr:vacuolar protein sorting-associated protein 54-like [Coccinella septempunctata]
MSGMASSSEKWSVYSASQNLSAVLNNPNLGKQSSFFVRTWGDSFVEKTDIESSPHLPAISYSHFEKYLIQYGRRIKRHKRLLQYKSSNNNITNTAKEKDDEKVDLEDIPVVFLKPEFELTDAGIFSTIFKNGEKCSTSSTSELINDLSRYLDIVEIQIAKHVSQKSDAFFHTMTSHDTIMEQMKNTCKEVHRLRNKLQKVDQLLAKDPLYLLGLKRKIVNHIKVLHKLKLMSTVLQTQPNIQLLLSSSDYVSALELIADTQKVLANELAGVTSLRHLPQQLKEMLKLIDKMLHTEFERYAAADLHRPLDNSKNVLETDHLVSLVLGLLRQNHTQFLEIFKQESITAAQTLLKQFMIEALADVEDDEEQCLRGSGEVTLSMDATHWMKALTAASEALRMFKTFHFFHSLYSFQKSVSESKLQSF